MRAIDTNILIRFVTRDDEGQFQTAAKFFSECSEESPGFVTSIVLVERANFIEANSSHQQQRNRD